MKTASRKIRVAATALCTVFALCSFALAVGAVNTTRKCALSVKIGDTALTAEEKPAVEITASLYKVADFAGDTYTYTALPGFAADLSGFASFTTDTITAQTTAAAAVVAAPGSTAAPAQTVVFKGDETGRFADVEAALYLLTATAVDSTGTYDYTFTPVLLSLPSMNEDGSDAYDISGVELKFSRAPATTSLKIQKDLTTYSALQGPATFVFQVEAVKNGKTVYSNVLSMVFTAAGRQTLEVKDLPIGATVTVTEVYGGSSYTVKTDREQVITLTKPEPDAAPATVAFVNDYNKKTPSSHSVTNRFTRGEGGWTVDQNVDRAPAEQ